MERLSSSSGPSEAEEERREKEKVIRKIKQVKAQAMEGSVRL